MPRRQFAPPPIGVLLLLLWSLIEPAPRSEIADHCDSPPLPSNELRVHNTLTRRHVALHFEWRPREYDNHNIVIAIRKDIRNANGATAALYTSLFLFTVVCTLLFRRAVANAGEVLPAWVGRQTSRNDRAVAYLLRVGPRDYETRI